MKTVEFTTNKGVIRAGQVVSKAELFATIWPDTVVGEETLTSFIHLLRRALKDDSRQPRYVATVHRVGYRFIAPFTIPPPVSSSRFPQTRTNPQITQLRSEAQPSGRAHLHLRPCLRASF